MVETNQTISDLCDLSFYNESDLWTYPRHCMTTDQYCNSTFYWHGRRPFQCEFGVLVLISGIALLVLIVFTAGLAYTYSLLEKRIQGGRQLEMIARRDRNLAVMLLNESGRRSTYTSWQNLVRSMPFAAFVESVRKDMDVFRTNDLLSSSSSSQRHRDRRSAFEREPQCAICLTDLSDDDDEIARSSNKDSRCSHIFHKDCIIEWLAVAPNPSCPCCRCVFLKPERLIKMNVIINEDEEPTTNEESSGNSNDEESQTILNSSAIPVGDENV